MSGGIDSSVAAFLLLKQGYEVEGAIMEIYDQSMGLKPSGFNACFGPGEVEDLKDAQKVADFLNIPLHIIDLKKKYKKDILDFFISEYNAGNTPNPCTKCNCKLKFEAISKQLIKRGISFNYFATGHYARVEFNKVTNQYLLKKGSDPTKDQSYFLYKLSKDFLIKIKFPLGKLTKDQVREIAKRELPFLSEKGESQDFIEGGYHQLFAGKSRQGPIINTNGETIGTHKGIVYYTVGQRRGIGISHKNPLYVIKKDKDQNAIIVGDKNDLFSNSFYIKDLNWLIKDKPANKIDVKVKIRFNSSEVSAVISPVSNKRAFVEFNNPQSSVTPGQACVMFAGDTVIGGGTIE